MLYIYISLIILPFGIVYDVMGQGSLNHKESAMIKSFRAIIVAVTFLILAVISGIRYGIGTDYFAYENIFVQIKQGSYNIEPLFGALNKLAAMFGDFQILIIVSSLIFLGFVYKYILDNRSSLFWGIFVLIFSTFYNMSFNAIRQCMATAIFLFAIRYIKEKKLGRYIVIILIAGCIHSMAFMYLPIYFVRYLKLNLKTFILGSSLSIVIYIVLKKYLYKLAILFPNISNYEANNFNAVDAQFKLFAVIQILIIIILFSITSKKFYDQMQFLEIKILFTLIFWILISAALPLGYRLIFMISPIEIVLIPKVIHSVHNLLLRCLTSTALAILLIWSFKVAIIDLNWHQTLPYLSVFRVLGHI